MLQFVFRGFVYKLILYYNATIYLCVYLQGTLVCVCECIYVYVHIMMLTTIYLSIFIKYVYNNIRYLFSVCVCECINVYVHIMDVNNYLSIYIYPEYIYHIFLSNFIYL